MKNIISLMLASAMLMSMAACGDNAESSATETTTDAAEVTTEAVTEELTEEITEAQADTVGAALLADFNARIAENPDMSAQEMADALLTNSVIQFSGVTMPVENGLLTGFGNAEITGFSEGVTFAPMIGTIAFVGYVFKLDEGTDAESFKQTLADNADPRWNICTEADETVIESSGNTVFFLMCPSQFEE